MKRKLGENLWCLTGNVVVFLNDEFVGDETTLISFLASTYKINLTFNWHEIGICALKNHLLSITNKCVWKFLIIYILSKRNDKKVLLSEANGIFYSDDQQEKRWYNAIWIVQRLGSHNMSKFLEKMRI